MGFVPALWLTIKEAALWLCLSPFSPEGDVVPASRVKPLDTSLGRWQASGGQVGKKKKKKHLSLFQAARLSERRLLSRVEEVGYTA